MHDITLRWKEAHNYSVSRAVFQRTLHRTEEHLDGAAFVSLARVSPAGGLAGAP